MRGLLGEEVEGSGGSIGAPWQLCLKRSGLVDATIDILIFNNVGEQPTAIEDVTVDGTLRGLMGLVGMPGQDGDQDIAGQYIRKIKEAYGVVIKVQTAPIVIGFAGARERRGTPAGPSVPLNFVHAGGQALVEYAVGQAFCFGAVPESVRLAVETMNLQAVLADFGTAGSASIDVETIQGILGMRPVVVREKVCEVTWTIATTAITYDPLGCMGAVQALDAVAPGADLHGRISQLIITDKDKVGGAWDQYFLSANQSMGTDGSANDISAANAQKITGCLNVLASDWTILTNAYVAVINFEKGKGPLLVAVAADDAVYTQAISRSTTARTANALYCRAILEEVE